MMELRVHVDNKLRIVYGLNEKTTVQDVILALAHSLKQIGKFYLIENYSPKLSNTKRLPRILAPTERPLEILKSQSHCDSNEEIEFHLLRVDLNSDNNQETIISTSAVFDDEPGQFARCFHEFDYLNKLYMKITYQQHLLNEQSAKLDDLLIGIKRQELENTNLKSMSRLNLNETDFLKKKLFHLELKHKLNERKLAKLEKREEDGDVTLDKEKELSEFLRAQLDYYRRKLKNSKLKIEFLERQYEQLKTEYEHLNDSIQFTDSCASTLSTPSLSSILNEDDDQTEARLNESLKKHEQNKARLNYLETILANVDKCVSNKLDIIENLEKQLQELSENDAKTAESTLSDEESDQNLTNERAAPLNSSVSSLSTSSDSDLTSICSNNLKNTTTSNGHCSKFKRLSKSSKAPLVNLKDIHYF